MLLPMPVGDNLAMEPVEAFLKNLATYKSKALEEDQKSGLIAIFSLGSST
jgi:hypothetical protein